MIKEASPELEVMSSKELAEDQRIAIALAGGTSDISMTKFERDVKALQEVDDAIKENEEEGA